MLSQPSSHIVPRVPLMHNSTVPSKGVSPSKRNMSPSVQFCMLQRSSTVWWWEQSGEVSKAQSSKLDSLPLHWKLPTAMYPIPGSNWEPSRVLCTRNVHAYRVCVQNLNKCNWLIWVCICTWKWKAKLRACYSGIVHIKWIVTDWSPLSIKA